MQAKSRLIPQRRSSALTKKIMTLASVHEQKDLKRNVYATNRVKSSNKNLLYIVDAVNEAISRNCKITFRYTDYSPAKRKILRNDGEVYTLSPFALFWNQDYYYVVGYSEKHGNISNFRADRICSIELTDEKAVKRPKDFSLARYSQQIFEMYDGDTVKVKLECSNHLMKYVVDRFGEKVKTEIATNDTFYAYPEVALSPNFYSWVFKFAGEIRIKSPNKAVAEISTMAQKMIIAESI